MKFSWLARVPARWALPLIAAMPSAAAAQHGGAEALVATTDPISQAVAGVTIVALFALLTREAAHRVLIAMGAASVLWLVTYLTPYHVIPFEAAWRHIDINVLLLLAGMMALIGVLKDTGVFGWAVARLVRRSGGRPLSVLTLLVWLTALLSAALDNVTTVIFVAPMAIAMARQLRVPPVALLIPVVLASNVGGTATLVGDPPNIIIASGADLSFGSFLVNVAGPAVAMIFLVEYMSARFFGAMLVAPGGENVLPEVPPISNERLLRWMYVVMAGVFAGFLTQRLTGMPPAVPAVVGAAAAMGIQDFLYLRTTRPTFDERQHGILNIFHGDIEWPTLAFFAFLFVVVGAAVETGLIGRVATELVELVRGGSALLGLGDTGTLLFAALLICWVSGVLSGFVDNIPFVAVAIPIVHTLVAELHGDTTVLWWALSLGACLGGNATAVGASANVTVIGLAERAGEPISFSTFFRYGAPFAAVTLVVSSLYLAVFVYAGAWAAYGGFVAFAAVLGIMRVMRRRVA